MGAEMRERFVGTLLGLMTGDALGRAVKGRTLEEIAGREDLGQEMIGGFYTEDTEMTFAVAETLLEQGGIDADALANKLGTLYSPMRGYNPGLVEVMDKLQIGMDWRDASLAVFPDGSYGFGGSCRAAPIGLYFHTAPDALVMAAAESAQVTHSHAIGVAGAITVALGVRLAVLGVPPHGALDEIETVLSAAGYEALLPSFETVRGLLNGFPTPAQVVAALGNTLTVQACVMAGLYCVLRHPDSFEQAVTFALRLGGDTDTIAAVAGALSGAYHAASAIPERWLWRLENEERGRDAIIALAEQLYAAWEGQ